MFPYFGSKERLSKYYPPPKYDLIIEPFAGSARYSLKYFDRDVILIDKNPKIISIWRYLQQASSKDILSLPKFKKGDRIKKEDFDYDGQFYLLQTFFNIYCDKIQAKQMTSFAEGCYETYKRNVLRNLFKIKHWKFICKDYIDIPNYIGTWFIDPPYQVQGNSAYTIYSGKQINFQQLGEWCRNRKGQKIVCEYLGSNWLPFIPLNTFGRNIIAGVNNNAKKKGTEVIWTNIPIERPSFKISG